MRVRRTLAVHWLREMCLLINLKRRKTKKAMGTSSAGRARRKATARRLVRRPVDISSGSGSSSDFGSDSTVPEAEEEDSGFSDEE
jgi:hypothetical protein